MLDLYTSVLVVTLLFLLITDAGQTAPGGSPTNRGAEEEDTWRTRGMFRGPNPISTRHTDG